MYSYLSKYLYPTPLLVRHCLAINKSSRAFSSAPVGLQREFMQARGWLGHERYLAFLRRAIQQGEPSTVERSGFVIYHISDVWISRTDLDKVPGSGE